MTTKEKNAMIRNMYRIIEEDGITSHIYRDGDWRKVYGGGQIVAAFAGSIEEPWDAYDVCATWWAVSSKYDEALATINNALKKAK